MKEWKKIEGLISVYNNRAKIITWKRTKSAQKDETVLLLLHFNRHYAVREWVNEICKMVFERVALIASNGAKQKQKNKNKLRISLTRTIKMVSVWYCKVAQTLNSKLIFFLTLNLLFFSYFFYNSSWKFSLAFFTLLLVCEWWSGLTRPVCAQLNGFLH